MSAQDKAEIRYWKGEYKKSRKDPVVLYNLATAYFYAKDWKRAAKYYSRASKIKSNLTYLASYYLALSLIELERFERSYKILKALSNRKLPQDLKLRVKEYIALFEGGTDEESGQSEQSGEQSGKSFWSRFSANLEASYGQSSNPGYATADSEESSSSLTTNLYLALKAIEQPKFSLEPYLNHYQEQYADLSTSDSTTRDIGFNYFQFFEKGYLQINPYRSQDSDEDSDTYLRTGGNLTYSKGNEDVFTATYYESTTDDSSLIYFTGKTLELSYTNMFSERKNEFRYTTFKLFKNDLNDTDDYYNSNRGVDISTGITRYFEKSNLTGSLRFTYKEYVEDETLEMARYDKTWNLTIRYDYPISKYFSVIANGNYLKNGSNWDDIEDYDPTYEVISYSLGLTGSI